MTINELRKLIETGEKIDIEFKKSQDKLNKDLYESVCSFNNRDGGHIFLGIVDKTKEICGVNPDKIDKMKKDFTTAVNNPNKINPPMYLLPEDYEIDGKRIIYIRVPEGTQVRRLNGRIFDRTYEGDIDITDNAELVYKMYGRKQNTYFVNKVYPNLGLEFLDFDVIKKAKKLAMGRVDNHAWTDMDEEGILRSSGLILTDSDTGKEGITLAAILLFGKDSTIMSVLPQYKTDAIYRVKNMDRYDDREVVITNLIDSFRRLMDFGKKHLNDVFVLDGEQSISARDKILREIISNILAHRDYSSAYSAKLVIEKETMYTENSNLPHGHGELQLNKIVEDYDGKVAVVFRTYVMSYHKNGVLTAAAANAAAKQGYWVAYKDILFNNQADWDNLGSSALRKKLEDYFVEASQGNGDINKFIGDMQDAEVYQKIAFDMGISDKAGLQWTPSVFVDGEFISQKKNESTSYSPAEFNQMIRDKIDEKLEEKNK